MPMQITCPQCGTTTDVADDCAGQTRICTHCGNALTASPPGEVPPKWYQLDLSSRSLRNGILFIMLIVGCDAAGMGIGLLLPAIEAAREAGRRQKCSKNLTQIGLAMQSYHHTSYAMIVGPHGISDGPTSRKLTDITDGPSKTIMMAECAGANICWLEPRDLDAEQIISIEAQPAAEQAQSGGIRTCHSGLRHVLFCNGTDQFLDPTTAIKAMITIDGGEITRHPSP